MSTYREQRRTPRYDVRMRVLFRKKGAAYFYESRSVNISTRGAFVPTRHKQLEVDTPVILMLVDERLEDSVPLQGHVAWVRTEAMDETPAGIGISFDDLDEDKTAHLRDVLEQLAADAA